MTWAREKAARAALGLCSLFLILALVSLWISYRMATFPIRKLSRDSTVAKRQATVGLAMAVFAMIAATRSRPSSSTWPSPPTADTSFTEDDDAP